MSDAPKNEQAGGWALSGCALTFVIWLFAAVVMLFTFGGDCFPEVSAGCPSDHERAMSLVWVALGAVALNGAGLFVLAWLHARGSSPR